MRAKGVKGVGGGELFSGTKSNRLLVQESNQFALLSDKKVLCLQTWSQRNSKSAKEEKKEERAG